MTDRSNTQAQNAVKRGHAPTHEDTVPDLLAYRRCLDHRIENTRLRRAIRDDIFALFTIILFVVGLLICCYILSYFFMG
jgi:hypothetical protein